MKAELVSRKEDLGGLAQRWDELALNDPRDGFFRTYGWYSAWMEHIRPDAQPFVVAVRDSAGKIAGLAPLCRLTCHDLGFRLKAVSYGGREVVSGDFLGFVSEHETRGEVTAAILDFLWEAQSHWGLLVMGELLDGGDLHRAAEDMAKRNGLPVRLQEERLCPYIELPSSFDEYLGTLSSSARYHIRRRIRDLVEKKGAHVEVYSQPEEVASRLDTLIRLHLARWRSDNLPGTLGRPGFAAFLRQVCLNPPAGSSCKFYMLSQEGRAAAALLAFHFGHSALYYQAGWDPDSPLAQHSPGVVVMAQSLRDAIEQGLRYYEFLRGDESYKSRWTKTFRKTVTLLAGRSFMARQYLLAARLKDVAKRLLKSGAAPESTDSADRQDRGDAQGDSSGSQEQGTASRATIGAGAGQ